MKSTHAKTVGVFRDAAQSQARADEKGEDVQRRGRSETAGRVRKRSNKVNDAVHDILPSPGGTLRKGSPVRAQQDIEGHERRQ